MADPQSDRGRRRFPGLRSGVRVTLRGRQDSGRLCLDTASLPGSVLPICALPILEAPVFGFTIRVRVNTLTCKDCEERFGRENARFKRGMDWNVARGIQLVCPRCGGTKTVPELEVEFRDLSRPSPTPQP